MVRQTVTHPDAPGPGRCLCGGLGQVQAVARWGATRRQEAGAVVRPCGLSPYTVPGFFRK